MVPGLLGGGWHFLSKCESIGTKQHDTVPLILGEQASLPSCIRKEGGCGFTHTWRVRSIQKPQALTGEVRVPGAAGRWPRGPQAIL